LATLERKGYDAEHAPKEMFQVGRIEAM